MSQLYQYGQDEHKLRSYLEEYAAKHHFQEMKRAIDYAWNMHDGATRINGEPFIIHPLFVAKYSIGIGARSEDQICIALLHDVCEDCGIKPTELPFNGHVQHAVEHLTYVYDFAASDSEEAKRIKKAITKATTFARLIECPDALICKCIDRYHNLSTCEELEEHDIIKNIWETHWLLLPQIYNALPMEMYAEYYELLFVLSFNLCKLNDLLAMKHGITFNNIP